MNTKNAQQLFGIYERYLVDLKKGMVVNRYLPDSFYLETLPKEIEKIEKFLSLIRPVCNSTGQEGLLRKLKLFHQMHLLHLLRSRLHKEGTSEWVQEHELCEIYQDLASIPYINSN
jgi:hypothetical protein